MGGRTAFVKYSDSIRIKLKIDGGGSEGMGKVV